MKSDDDVPVTSTQIAQMAGVRPSAVSNWRRRSTGFPEPIGTGARGADLFSREEVTKWLREHGYEPAEFDVAERVFSLLNVLRGSLGPDDAAALVIRWVLVADAIPPDERDRLQAMGRHEASRELLDAVRDVSRTLPGHDDAAWELALADPNPAALVLAECLATMSRAARGELLERLLDSLGGSARMRGSEHRTHGDLAELLVDLAAPIGGVVCDPAVGFGGTLLAAGKRARRDKTPLTALVGQGLTRDSAWVAAERLALSGFEADIAVGDALSQGVLGRGIADVVICDPPYGVTLRPGMLDPADERWFAGTPSGRAYEYAWLQYALWLTRPGSGRAIVVTPIGTTFAGGRANEIRRELVSRGMVEAVISLPAGSAGRATGIELAVWILRWPTPAEPAADVVFIDAARRGGDRRRPLTPELRADIVRCLADARAIRDSSTLDPEFVNELEIAARASIPAGAPRDQLNLSPNVWVGEAALGEFYDAYWEHTPENLSSIERAWQRTALADGEPVDESEIPVPYRLGDLIDSGQVSIARGISISQDQIVSEGIPITGRPGSSPRFVNPGTLPDDAPLTAAGDVLVRPAVAGQPLRAAVVEEGGEVLAGSVVSLRSHSPQIPARMLAASIEAEAFLKPPPGTQILNYTASSWLRAVHVPRLSEADANASAEVLTSIDVLEQELEHALWAVREWRGLSTRIAAAGRVRFPGGTASDENAVEGTA